MAAQPGKLEQVVPGVWFREGEQELSHCNNVVIEMKDYLIVVDANYPSGARMIMRDVKNVSSKPIKYVIDTHADADHAYGNPVFTRAGAVTIGYAGMLEDLKRNEPQSWRRVARYRKDMAELNLTAPEPPQQTYSRSPYVINDSRRRVELYHFGWGHTRGDTFVYLPKEKVLCTGDAVTHGPHHDPHYAYMGNWANEIRGAQKLNAVHVLPGHGRPGGKELLEGARHFFEALYSAVQAEVRKGTTLEQLVTVKDGRPVATTLRLPQAVMDAYVYQGPGLKPFQVSRFPTQVRNTYVEITRGKPWGDIPAEQ